jgi:outer membrane protein TolC
VHDHASVIAYDRQIEAARTDIALAQADKRPDWSVELDYSNRGRPFSDMVTLEFRIGLPLFAARRQDPLIASKRAELRKVEAERESDLRMHSAEVSQQLSDWQTLKERVKTYDTELVPLAHAQAQAALSAFQSAQSTLKPVLDARAAEINAQIQVLELRGQLGRAWAFLSYLQYPRRAP